jgi:hypothetical protein
MNERSEDNITTNWSQFFIKIALLLFKQRVSQSISLSPIILIIVSSYLSETLSSLINPWHQRYTESTLT